MCFSDTQASQSSSHFVPKIPFTSSCELDPSKLAEEYVDELGLGVSSCIDGVSFPREPIWSCIGSSVGQTKLYGHKDKPDENGMKGTVC